MGAIVAQPRCACLAGKGMKAEGGSDERRTIQHEQLLFHPSSLLFVEALDEVEVLAPVKSVGAEIVYQVAVVPVDHRIDERDTGAREFSKQFVHQSPAHALS